MDLSDSDSTTSQSSYSPSDDSLQITSPEIQLPIECRNPPQWWWMVPIGLAAAVFFIVELPAESPELPAGQTDWPIIFLSGIIGLFFGVFAIYLALELMFSSVRADERGLTSRRPFTGWKSTRWEEITDYYWAPRGDRVVITPAGKHRLDSSFRNVEQIADLVIAKTPHCQCQLGKKRHEAERKLVAQLFSVVGDDEMDGTIIHVAADCGIDYVDH